MIAVSVAVAGTHVVLVGRVDTLGGSASSSLTAVPVVAPCHCVDSRT